MTDARTPTPREVWEQTQRFVLDHDVDGYANLFAADGVQEFPFAPPGVPARLNGREEIRSRLGPAMRAAREAGRRSTGHGAVTVHETSDPEVIVVEFELLGEGGAGGSYRLPYVHVLKVRNGEIVSLRDYLDSFAVAQVIGTMPAFGGQSAPG